MKVCHICGKNYTSTHNLWKHVRKIHGIEPVNTCSICGKTFNNRFQLGGHIRAAHSNHNIHVSREHHWKYRNPERFEAFRKMLSERRLAELNPNWKGGKHKTTVRKIAYRLLGEPKTCMLCGGSLAEALDVHHIDGNRANNTKENLIILCRSCHESIHRGGTRALVNMALHYLPMEQLTLYARLLQYSKSRISNYLRQFLSMT